MLRNLKKQNRTVKILFDCYVAGRKSKVNGKNGRLRNEERLTLPWNNEQERLICGPVRKNFLLITATAKRYDFSAIKIEEIPAKLEFLKDHKRVPYHAGY